MNGISAGNTLLCEQKNIAGMLLKFRERIKNVTFIGTKFINQFYSLIKKT